MIDHIEPGFTTPQETPSPSPVAETPPAEAPVPAEVKAAGLTAEHGANGTSPSWHAEAGRKGAHRIHELIQAGKRYEQEHGLKRGRQRLRQLIEQGKLYEQEHGLRPRKKVRPARLSGEQLLQSLLQTLVRLVRPKYRPHVARLIQALETEVK